MLASLALRTEFTKRARELGDEYAADRRVEILGGGSDVVRAQVQGTSQYLVTIKRTSHDGATEFAASCTCPSIARVEEPCKHIWATLLTAERVGKLTGGSHATVLTRQSAYLTLRGTPRTTPEPSRAVDNGQGGLHRITVPAQQTATAFLDAIRERLRTSKHALRTTIPFAETTLLYVIDGPASVAAGRTVITIMGQRRSNPGGSGKPREIKFTPEDVAAAPPIDRRLLSLIAGGSERDVAGASKDWPLARSAASSFLLPDALALEVLPLIARTARLWLQRAPRALDLVPLVWEDGNAWRFRLQVDETTEGFRVDGRLERDGVNVRADEESLVLAGELVAVRRTLARFTRERSAVFLAELGRSGPVEIPRAKTDDLLVALAECDVRSDDLPPSLRTMTVDAPPRPRLSLTRPRDVEAASLTGELAFDYDGSLVRSDAAGPTTLDLKGRRLITRRLDLEEQALARLRDLGARSSWRHGRPTVELADHRFGAIVRVLLDEGWFVEAEGVRYRAPRRVRLAVTSGIDWFELSATVPFDDEHAIDLAEVLAAASAGRSMVRLGDGSVGIVPEEWMARYGALLSTGQVEDGRIRFRRSQVALLDALLSDRVDGAELEVDSAFERARSEIHAGAQIHPVEEPVSFAGTLRPYQRDGLGWFGFLRRFGFGGCLADDMGLGKTIMVLALLEARRTEATLDQPRRPSIIVVPRSLVGNWMAEARRFAPALRVVDHSHGGRHDSADALADCDALLVTYGTLRRDIETLSTIDFDYAILDEAQAIKNASTVSAKATRLIRARHRLALSGTPIENHLSELWSLFEFLNPGILGRSTAFHRVTATGENLEDTTKVLSRGLRPFVLRRTKQQVAHELPARTEHTIACELLPKDRRLYERLRTHFKTSVLDRVARDGLNKSRMHVLEALLRLRQASCHAGLIDPKRASDESAKFDVLVPRLQEVVAEGHKALVFSQFTTLLGLLAPRLDAAKLKYEYLDGKTRDRSRRVDRFQTDPSVGVFLISLKAGGLGLNLTAAEYVFLLDPWWNPAVEAQAIDRAHRIGQTREVFAYRLIAKDTVEEKVIQLQQSKRALADAVLAADGAGLRTLSPEDLELLLS